MVRYFSNETDIKSTWDHVVCAFWQRYPNPFSTHVLTEDVIFREVTPDHRMLSRRLLTKTNRLPRWAERIFPANLSRSVYIVEDSIVDPSNRSLTTFTWNLNHKTLMTVEERCTFQESQEHPTWTHLRREAWIFSGVYGFSRAIQEFGLARFKSNQVKAMKGLEHALSNLHVIVWEHSLDRELNHSGAEHRCFLYNMIMPSTFPGEGSQWLRKDAVKEASGKAKEAALAATETAKNLASAASPKKPQQFV